MVAEAWLGKVSITGYPKGRVRRGCARWPGSSAGVALPRDAIRRAARCVRRAPRAAWRRRIRATTDSNQGQGVAENLLDRGLDAS